MASHQEHVQTPPPHVQTPPAQQQNPYQQPMSPVQPQNAYHSPATSPQPQANPIQSLPPSYEQASGAKGPVAGQQVQNGQQQQQHPPASVTPLHMLGDQPQWIDCPFCHQRTMTTVTREGTSMQIVVGAVLCLFCICLTCVPCIAGWFENTEYRCSHCKNMVAIRPHDGPMQILGPQAVVASQYAPNQQQMHVPQQQQQQQQQQQHPMQKQADPNQQHQQQQYQQPQQYHSPPPQQHQQYQPPQQDYQQQQFQQQPQQHGQEQYHQQQYQQPQDQSHGIHQYPQTNASNEPPPKN